MNLTYVFLGNTVSGYLIALGVFITLVVLFKFAQWSVLKKLSDLSKKTKTDIDDTLVEIVKSLKPAFYYVLALYFGLQPLALSRFAENVIDNVLLIVIAYQVVTALHILVSYTLEKRARREGKDAQKAYRFLGTFIKWGLWVIATLTVISNLGVNITSLVAGLGIGGIAVALAMQNILSDLFSSFAIYFDKPFEIGDFIVVGESAGTVERIGIKTTRLRALQGEEVVISNQELTSARIQNLKKMEERRVALTFGVTYGTPPAKLRSIPKITFEIFETLKEKNPRLERVHLKTLSDSSLDFEVVYFVPNREYLDYMDIQQEFNFKLIERFEKEGIEFAYPTQTLHIKK